MHWHTIHPLPLEGHDFSQGHYDHTNRHISNNRVANERSGYHLARDTFWFIVDQVVWSQGSVKVEYFLRSENHTFLPSDVCIKLKSILYFHIQKNIKQILGHFLALQV